MLPVTICSALGAGLIGGVFFAFSSFVMRGLGRLAPGQGIAAMQAINVAVLNPLFLGVFVGTGVGCGVLGVAAVRGWGSPDAAYRLGAAALYLVGSLGVTGRCNVPRNDLLAALDPTDPRADELWRRYLREWTAWNHVRTAASLAAAALLVVSLLDA